MQDAQKILRWAVETDPCWEKLTDSNQSLYLKWIKKEPIFKQYVLLQAPIAILWVIQGTNTGLSDLSTNFTAWSKHDMLSGGDITKYLSSRYLNPGTYSSPGFDIIRGNLLKMRKILIKNHIRIRIANIS